MNLSRLIQLAPVATNYRALRAEFPAATAVQVKKYLDGAEGETFEQFHCAHRFVCSGTDYGGEDERYGGEGRCYCENCGLDGDG